MQRAALNPYLITAKNISKLPTVLSFHATKSFSTAEGGCVISNDHDLIERVTSNLNFGFINTRETEVPGINGKMGEYNAAIGLAELDSWNEKKALLEQVSDLYHEAAKTRGIQHKLIIAPNVCSSYALFAADNPEEAQVVKSNLEKAGIEFRYWYGNGLHRQKHYYDSAAVSSPVTDHLASTLLGLPVAPDLDSIAVNLICDQLIP